MTQSIEKPKIVKISAQLLPGFVSRGWQMFLQTRPLSVSFSMVFALIGVAILASITRASYAPLIFPVSGGFMLVGPFLLSGFFALADRLEKGQECSASDIRFGFSQTNGGIFAIALLCAFIFVLWLINAAYQYGRIVGRSPEPLFNLLAPSADVWAFLVWSSILGASFAFLVFAISAFSVPLLYYRRARLFQAVGLSIQAVIRNFFACILWSLILTVSIVISIVVFPLFLIVFPVLAYASHALYLAIFPQGGADSVLESRA